MHTYIARCNTSPVQQHGSLNLPNDSACEVESKSAAVISATNDNTYGTAVTFISNWRDLKDKKSQINATIMLRLAIIIM